MIQLPSRQVITVTKGIEIDIILRVIVAPGDVERSH